MTKHVTLERINSGKKVAFFSVLYDGETKNEFQKFIEKYGADDAYKDDLGIILARIQKVEISGAEQSERNIRARQMVEKAEEQE